MISSSIPCSTDHVDRLDSFESLRERCASAHVRLCTCGRKIIHAGSSLTIQFLVVRTFVYESRRT